MTLVSCDGFSCCSHPAESEAVLKRDGALYLVCLECHQEKGPAPEITQMACGVPELVTPPVIPFMVSAAIGNTNGIESGQLTQKDSTPVAVLTPQDAPCGEDVAHKWGGVL